MGTAHTTPHRAFYIQYSIQYLKHAYGYIIISYDSYDNTDKLLHSSTVALTVTDCAAANHFSFLSRLVDWSSSSISTGVTKAEGLASD